MAKKMSDAERARALLEQDYQENPDAPYQEDQGVIDAANKAFHSAGEMQRQTHRQMFNAEMSKKDMEEMMRLKAEALSKKKGK